MCKFAHVDRPKAICGKCPSLDIATDPLPQAILCHRPSSATKSRTLATVLWTVATDTLTYSRLTNCLSLAQGFDQELDQAEREGRATAPAAGERLQAATAAFDALLATVPEPLLERARRVAAAAAALPSPEASEVDSGGGMAGGASSLEKLVPLAS